jgi:hypothetical protein
LSSLQCILNQSLGLSWVFKIMISLACSYERRAYYLEFFLIDNHPALKKFAPVFERRFCLIAQRFQSWIRSKILIFEWICRVTFVVIFALIIEALHDLTCMQGSCWKVES